MRSTEAVCASFGVQLIVERVIYAVRGGSTATEVVVTFRNTGPNATAPLCNVRTLNASLLLSATANLTVSAHTGSGTLGESKTHPFTSPATQIGATLPDHDNFHPILAHFPIGSGYTMGSGEGGRSSEGGLPFFSAYSTDESKYDGITVSVGWSGYWSATLNHTSTALEVTAGQGEFCAPIGAGGSFTFPRVLLVEWSGDSPQIGVNAHRRVVVDHKLLRDPTSGEPVGMVRFSIDFDRFRLFYDCFWFLLTADVRVKRMQ